MKKKNTLLYLDEDLVRRAKKLGINISRATENALAKHLMQTDDKIDFGEYLDTLEIEEECFYLPFQVKNFEAINIGPHKRIHLDFDNITLIRGDNGSGKSILLKAMASLFGYTGIYNAELLREDAKKGNIKVEVDPDKEISMQISHKGRIKGSQLLLLDDAFARLDDKTARDFWKYLKKLDTQIIFTMSKPDKRIPMKGVKVLEI